MSEKISVTLKGDGRDAPWIVIKAETVDEAKALVGEAASLSTEGVDLVGLAHNAARALQNTNRVGQVLGGTVVSSSGTVSVSDEVAAKLTEPTPEAEPASGDPLLKAIENAQSKSALTDLYIDHKAKFAPGSALLAAMQKRSAELG